MITFSSLIIGCNPLENFVSKQPDVVSNVLGSGLFLNIVETISNRLVWIFDFVLFTFVFAVLGYIIFFSVFRAFFNPIFRKVMQW